MRPVPRVLTCAHWPLHALHTLHALHALHALHSIHNPCLKDKLVAIVVPDPEALVLFASKPENKIEGGVGKSVEELCAMPSVRAAVHKDMTKRGKAAALKGFEFAKAIHLEPAPFAVENGLLTPTFKLKRQPARDHYRAVIDDLYEELKATPLAAKL